jgi:hypothetical protein
VCEPSTHLDVLDGEARGGGGHGGLDGAALLDIDDGTVAWALGGTRAGGSNSVGEHDATEIGERNQGASLLEILNDPLGVLKAQSAGASEGLGDGLASGDVLNDSLAGLGAAGGNGGLDHISGGNGQGEIVGVVWVPLVPRIVAAANSEVNSSLENGGLAAIAINSDPGGGGSSAAARWIRDGELGSDSLPGVTRWWGFDDGTRPVGAVRHLGLVARGLCSFDSHDRVARSLGSTAGHTLSVSFTG